MTRNTHETKTCSLPCFIPITSVYGSPPSSSSLIYKLEKNGPPEETEDLVVKNTLQLLRKLHVRACDINKLGFEPVYIQLVYNAADRNDLLSIMFQYVIKVTGDPFIVDRLYKKFNTYFSG